MQTIIDITGNKYNKLTVLGFDHLFVRANGKTRSYWKCQCDCGNIVVLRKDSFIYPYSKVKSCGCWHREESSNRPKDDKTGKFILLNSGGGHERNKENSES